MFPEFFFFFFSKRSIVFYTVFKLYEIHQNSEFVVDTSDHKIM